MIFDYYIDQLTNKIYDKLIPPEAAPDPIKAPEIAPRPIYYYEPIKQSIPYLYDSILSGSHCLIAGTTGSGKSVLLNGIICNFLVNNHPNNKLYLIDPKRVELSIYKGLPHVAGYTSDAGTACKMLEDILAEIERRYKLMETDRLRTWPGDHIYIIVDEMADIMISTYKKDFTIKLQRILQIARAAGVHAICCTQAPNRQIINASVVLNFTNRVALRCMNSIESRQIINQAGAELLPRYGACLYLEPGQPIKQYNIPFYNMDMINNKIRPWLNGDMIAR